MNDTHYVWNYRTGSDVSRLVSPKKGGIYDRVPKATDNDLESAREEISRRVRRAVLQKSNKPGAKGPRPGFEEEYPPEEVAPQTPKAVKDGSSLNLKGKEPETNDQTPLKRLKKMKPEDLEVRKPWESQHWRDHLKYLLEDKPQWTKKMFEKDKKGLAEHLLVTTQRAVIFATILMLENPNLQPDQIQEIVSAKVTAPVEGLPEFMEEPEPLPWKLAAQIEAWSEDPDQIKTML